MLNSDLALNPQEITTKKAKELPMSSRVAVFPIGSNEQHGPHLTIPLLAEAIANSMLRVDGKDQNIMLRTFSPERFKCSCDG